MISLLIIHEFYNSTYIVYVQYLYVRIPTAIDEWTRYLPRNVKQLKQVICLLLPTHTSFKEYPAVKAYGLLNGLSQHRLSNITHATYRILKRVINELQRVNKISLTNVSLSIISEL